MYTLGNDSTANNVLGLHLFASSSDLSVMYRNVFMFK